jgi:hypothetical protein
VALEVEAATSTNELATARGMGNPNPKTNQGTANTPPPMPHMALYAPSTTPPNASTHGRGATACGATVEAFIRAHCRWFPG